MRLALGCILSFGLLDVVQMMMSDPIPLAIPDPRQNPILQPESKVGLYKSKDGPLGYTPFYLKYGYNLPPHLHYQQQYHPSPYYMPNEEVEEYYPQSRSADWDEIPWPDSSLHVHPFVANIAGMMSPLHRPIFHNLFYDDEDGITKVQDRKPRSILLNPYNPSMGLFQ